MNLYNIVVHKLDTAKKLQEFPRMCKPAETHDLFSAHNCYILQN